MTWQPIETAPEPFKNVLLWDGENLWVGFYWPRRGGFYSDFQTVYPTHWMPMPEPPEEE